MASPVSLQLHDAPRYEEFYGFVHPPFTPDPDPCFLYPSKPYEAATRLLLDSVRRREPFTLITGDSGTGKTTTCRTLVGKLDTATVTSLILEPVSSAEDLLRKVLVDLGVISRQGIEGGRAAAATREELVATLRGFLRSLAPINASGVVIVDEAHQLSPDVLRQIGDLAASGSGESDRLAIVLAGEPELLDTLAAAETQELNARISVRATLEPLAREEVGSYVAHRLSAAGGPGAPAFDRGALDALYEHTHGVLGTLNALCERSLTLGAQLDVRVIGREIVDEASRGVGQPSPRPPPATWWNLVPLWSWIALAILLLLAIMAVSFSGAA